MNKGNHTFLDTDLHIHRLAIDLSVRAAACSVFETNHPTAMSAFSLVELKGSYIQDLILVHRKILNADSFERGFAKILNSGGRRCFLMAAQLINLLGGVGYEISPWSEARQQLLTYLDAQIEIS